MDLILHPIWTQNGLIFGTKMEPEMDPKWIILGLILGLFLDPKWHQNGARNDASFGPKIWLFRNGHSIFRPKNRLQNGPILGSKWTPKWVTFGLQIGPKMELIWD